MCVRVWTYTDALQLTMRLDPNKALLNCKHYKLQISLTSHLPNIVANRAALTVLGTCLCIGTDGALCGSACPRVWCPAGATPGLC